MHFPAWAGEQRGFAHGDQISARITSPGTPPALWILLTLCDSEFVPPLSARVSTTQHALGPAEGDAIPEEYYDNIAQQHTLVAYESRQSRGLSLPTSWTMCARRSRPVPAQRLHHHPIIVHPDWRRHGITNALTPSLIGMPRWRRQLFTRPGAPTSPTRIQASLGFHEHIGLKTTGEGGIDTVYYHYSPATRSRWQILRQYHLTGNLLFFLHSALCHPGLFGGLLQHQHQRHCPRAVHRLCSPPLIASALSAQRHPAENHRESKNDEYINKLKSFGVENLQFHKNELLESICLGAPTRSGSPATGSIMTAKASFRRSIGHRLPPPAGTADETCWWSPSGPDLSAI